MVLQAIVLVVALLVSTQAFAERRVALLIGNATYSAPATVLKNPPNDVAAIKTMLTGAGFDVTVLENATRAAMSDALAAFEEKVSGADVGLVYYSGHGIEVNGENFLIPVDAKLSSDRHVKYETIVLDDFMNTLAGAAKLKLVLLDACRDNPFLASMKKAATRGAASRGLARVESTESNMLVGYATAPGDVALDGEGVMSPYAAALTRHLVTPGLEIESALRAVARDVFEKTDGKQRPYISGSLFETVLLGPNLPLEETTSSCSDAGRHWDEIKDSGDKELFAEHQRLFANCPFASLARKKAESLTVVQSLPEQCDVLAAFAWDAQKPKNISAVPFDKLNGAEALAACQKAIDKYPDNARFRFQFGRSLLATSNYKEALKQFHIAADLGSTVALNAIGSVYQSGDGLPRDLVEAAKWYKKAADVNDMAGLYNVGWFYRDGAGDIPQDYVKAKYWFERSAQHGNTSAMVELASLYEKGNGVPQSDEIALRWYNAAASGGDTDAMHALGDKHYFGNGAVKDVTKAFDWYKRASAGGNVAAMHSLAVLYDNGTGVTLDQTEATNWFLKAAEEDNEDAIKEMGRRYEGGIGTPQNWTEAFRWYSKAALLGDDKAMLGLGKLLALGKGTSVSFPQAHHWFIKSAEKGNLLAMRELAKAYDNGQGVAISPLDALSWYEKAALAGDGPSAFQAAVRYSNGIGTAIDNKKAAAMYRVAATAGNKDAMFFLATIRHEGLDGSKPDYREAAQWFEQSIRHGSSVALGQAEEGLRKWRGEFRRALQARLKAAGVYTGKIDGDFGDASVNSLKSLVGTGIKS